MAPARRYTEYKDYFVTRSDPQGVVAQTDSPKEPESSLPGDVITPLPDENREEKVTVKHKAKLIFDKENRVGSLDDAPVRLKVLAIPRKDFEKEIKLPYDQCVRCLKSFYGKPARFEHIKENLGMVTSVSFGEEGMFAEMTYHGPNSATTPRQLNMLTYVRDRLVDRTMAEVSVGFKRIYSPYDDKNPISMVGTEISVVFNGALRTRIETVELSALKRIQEMASKDEKKATPAPDTTEKKETVNSPPKPSAAAAGIFSGLTKTKGIKVDENGAYLDAEEDKRKESFLRDIMGFDESVYSAMNTNVKEHLFEYTNKTLVPAFNKLSELSEMEKDFETKYGEIEEQYSEMKSISDDLVVATNDFFSQSGIRARANAKTITEAMQNVCTQLELSQAALAAEQQKNAKQESEYNRLMKMANVPQHLSNSMKFREETAAYSGRQKKRLQREEEEDEEEEDEEEEDPAPKKKNKKANTKNFDKKWSMETLKQFSAQGEIKDDESIERVSRMFNPDQLHRMITGKITGNSTKESNSHGLVSKRREDPKKD